MYWIITDSTIDMGQQFTQGKEKFVVLSLSYIMDGQSYTPDGTDEGTRAIYDQLRAGKVLTTSQVNSESWKAAFKAVLEQGEDVLCIAFSSGLSGTCQAAFTAAEQLREKYPERRVEVIDSLAASAGEGLLVHYALENRAAGMSLEDNAQWVRDHVQKTIHWFTVDDLMFLKRGGRVGAMSAYVGTLVKIKPVMHVNEEGRLIPREKVMGRRKSLSALAEKIRQSIVNPEEQTVLITHGDCEEDARYVAGLIKDSCPVKDVKISYVGPVIGAHTGPGVVAVFCLGEKR